jgi:hypothetical protein
MRNSLPHLDETRPHGVERFRASLGFQIALAIIQLRLNPGLDHLRVLISVVGEAVCDVRQLLCEAIISCLFVGRTLGEPPDFPVKVDLLQLVAIRHDLVKPHDAMRLQPARMSPRHVELHCWSRYRWNV